jgi:hypothetical protein
MNLTAITQETERGASPLGARLKSAPPASSGLCNGRAADNGTAGTSAGPRRRCCDARLGKLREPIDARSWLARGHLKKYLWSC